MVVKDCSFLPSNIHNKFVIENILYLVAFIFDITREYFINYQKLLINNQDIYISKIIKIPH